MLPCPHAPGELRQDFVGDPAERQALVQEREDQVIEAPILGEDGDVIRRASGQRRPRQRHAEEARLVEVGLHRAAGRRDPRRPRPHVVVADEDRLHGHRDGVARDERHGTRPRKEALAVDHLGGAGRVRESCLTVEIGVEPDDESVRLSAASRDPLEIATDVRALERTVVERGQILRLEEDVLLAGPALLPRIRLDSAGGAHVETELVAFPGRHATLVEVRRRGHAHANDVALRNQGAATLQEPSARIDDRRHVMLEQR